MNKRKSNFKKTKTTKNRHFFSQSARGESIHETRALLFQKNDESFRCENCGTVAEKLSYTSRDHCNKCLHSKHVDVNPGDRKETCHGVLVPVGVQQKGKKGLQIIYRCSKCGVTRKNIAAKDDNDEAIMNLFKLPT